MANVGPAPSSIAPNQAAPRLGWEVLVVLGLSFGQSGIWALLRLIRNLTLAEPLKQQTAAMNQQVTPVAWLDVLYQVADVVFALVPAGLVIYLLWARPAWSARDGQLEADAAAHLGPLAHPGPLARLGFDLSRPLADAGRGAGLAALVGLPGIGFYVLGRQLGITMHVTTNNLGGGWWTWGLLILAAIGAGVSEEVVVVGYLTTRLRTMGWSWLWIMAAGAVLRGSYHLYQGVGPFLGNVVMGLVFCWAYWRGRRVMVLVVAHVLMDVVAFVGPSLLPASWLA